MQLVFPCPRSRRLYKDALSHSSSRKLPGGPAHTVCRHLQSNSVRTTCLSRRQHNSVDTDTKSWPVSLGLPFHVAANEADPEACLTSWGSITAPTRPTHGLPGVSPPLGPGSREHAISKIGASLTSSGQADRRVDWRAGEIPVRTLDLVLALAVREGGGPAGQGTCPMVRF